MTIICTSTWARVYVERWRSTIGPETKADVLRGIRRQSLEASTRAERDACREALRVIRDIQTRLT
jgi:hypothetical protein